MISTCSIAINETGRDSSIPIDLISSSGYNWVSKDENRSVVLNFSHAILLTFR